MKPVSKLEYYFGRSFEFVVKSIYIGAIIYLGYVALLYTYFRAYYPYYTIAIIAGMLLGYLQYLKHRHWAPLTAADMQELLQLVKEFPEASTALNERIAKQPAVLYRDLVALKRHFKGASL